MIQISEKDYLLVEQAKLEMKDNKELQSVATLNGLYVLQTIKRRIRLGFNTTIPKNTSHAWIAAMAMNGEPGFYLNRYPTKYSVSFGLMDRVDIRNKELYDLMKNWYCYNAYLHMDYVKGVVEYKIKLITGLVITAQLNVPTLDGLDTGTHDKNIIMYIPLSIAEYIKSFGVDSLFSSYTPEILDILAQSTQHK